MSSLPLCSLVCSIPHISSCSLHNLSQFCVCLFALSMVELARLSQFLHLILREMTMLQSAAIISQIKALKLNLARLKKITRAPIASFTFASVSLLAAKGVWDSALCVRCVCVCEGFCVCIHACLHPQIVGVCRVSFSVSTLPLVEGTERAKMHTHLQQLQQEATSAEIPLVFFHLDVLYRNLSRDCK